MHLSCTKRKFDTNSETITTVKLLNISHKVTIFLRGRGIRGLEIYSFSKFPVFNTVLTIVIMLYITLLDLFILHNCTFVPFYQNLHISPLPAPPGFGNHHCILLIWMRHFLDSAYKWDHAVFVFLCLAYLA